MKRILSRWSKDVKKEMIERDMNTADMCERFHWSKQYTNNIINGYYYNRGAVQLISAFLDLPEPGENETLSKVKR